MNQFHRRRPTPPDGRVYHDHNSQPEVRRGQADDGQGAPQVVGDGILANRRVDADRQGDHQSDDDGQDTQLESDRQSIKNRLLYRVTGQQGLA